MVRRLFMLSLLVLISTAVFAQEFPRYDVGVMYTYARFSPDVKYTPSMNLNGAGGSFTLNANEYVGIKAELMGYGASKATWTIPAGNPVLPAGGNITASGNLFTYLFGPQIRVPSKKFSPYVHALFGGSHTSAFADAIAACHTCSTSAAPSGNAFAMAIGGGFDLPVHRNVALKLGQFDYLLTRFNNQLTGTVNHNNFRYSAGLLFRFGSGSH